MFDGGIIGQSMGIKIIPSKFWPQEKPEQYIVRYKAHKIICWLAKYLPIEPYVEAEYTRYVDNDPLIVGGHTVHCSYAQYEQLKEKSK
ncbi:MAG: hypothetical protein ACUZ8E_17675 [Candidatus Anammoxibacter sp.]